MVVSKGCMASGNSSPCGSQPGGMVAGGSSRQGADEVYNPGELFHLCLVNIGFIHVGAIFSPLSPLLVMTITPTIENISAMSMCLTSSQKHSFLFASDKGEILSKLQLLKLSTQFVSKCQVSFTQPFQFCAFHRLSTPMDPSQILSKIKSL